MHGTLSYNSLVRNTGDSGKRQGLFMIKSLILFVLCTMCLYS